MAHEVFIFHSKEELEHYVSWAKEYSRRGLTGTREEIAMWKNLYPCPISPIQVPDEKEIADISEEYSPEYLTQGTFSEGFKQCLSRLGINNNLK